ncbi:MAG: ABC transporter substrate-binding protein [Alphaproteobacteria bacterium]|nr:ABC transporter substrate-binding protein [Alphaproteobacteria bacterium]
MLSNRLAMHFRPCLFLFAVIAFALSAKPAAAVDTERARNFVGGLAQTAIHNLTEPDLEDAILQARFRKLFREHFDLQTITRFVLGRYWNEATEAQKKEFQTLLEDYIVLANSGRFKGYAGEIFEVNDVREHGDKDAIVYTRIVRNTAAPVRIDWRVRQPNSDVKIIDVAIEGLSMVLTHRNEFAAVIQRSTNGIDGLLETLRQKTEGVNRESLAASP